ncbi:MAG: TRAP transporter large permease [Alphaproteobacteria bacterium]
MTPFEIGIVSVILIVVLIYAGLYVPVSLGLVSFLGVWFIRGDVQVAIDMLALAAADTIAHQVFATVPLFALMGLIVSKAGVGNDVYKVANFVFYKVKGGLGIATVAANAVFAAITGSSIASASVFARVSVPEMRKFGYTTRFSVGVVAGSSVLGMIIPPSAMLIIFAITADQSVGQLFIAGIIPGILLAVAFALAIVIMARFWPGFVGGHGIVESEDGGEEWQHLSWSDVALLMAPVVFLVLVVLGGIYGGIVTPVEAGAAGSLVALLIAVLRRSIDWGGFWECLVETGHITASILFLIVAASMYSRMLGFAGLPTLFQGWLDEQGFQVLGLMLIYIPMLLVLGTVIDTASMILIVAPLFLPAVEALDLDIVWFGIVTVIGAEIGLLTPPLGISCFVIKSTLNDPTIKLSDIFMGAFPFAVIMLIVLMAIIAWPDLSLALL